MLWIRTIGSRGAVLGGRASLARVAAPRNLCAATQALVPKKCSDHIATEKSLTAREPDPEALKFLQQRATALGLKLSLEERKLIVADADTNGDGRLSMEEWRLLVDRRLRCRIDVAFG